VSEVLSTWGQEYFYQDGHTHATQQSRQNQGIFAIGAVIRAQKAANGLAVLNGPKQQREVSQHNQK
jgi:hypothetical protein